MAVGLIVVAHPDDDALFAGPFQIANRWLEWHVVCATYEAGDARAQGLIDWQEKLGACSVTFLGLRDDPEDHGRGRSSFTTNQVVQELQRRVHVRPDLVLTHNQRGEYGHPHHVVVSDAVRQAFMQTQIMVFAHYEDTFDFEVRVADFSAEALGCFPSQRRAIRQYHGELRCCERGVYRVIAATPQTPCATEQPTLHRPLRPRKSKWSPLAFARRIRSGLGWRLEYHAGNLLRKGKKVATICGFPQTVDTPDRRLLEDQIIPYFREQNDCRRVLFVGCEWYTKIYENLWGDREYHTIEIDPAKRRYGASRHVVDGLQNLATHYDEQTFDLIVCNGVFGFGLNDRALVDQAFAACYSRLRPGGVFVLGWNDVSDHKPFPLEEAESLDLFTHWDFPPLGRSHFLTASENRHIFDFFQRPQSPQTASTGSDVTLSSPATRVACPPQRAVEPNE